MAFIFITNPAYEFQVLAMLEIQVSGGTGFVPHPGFDKLPHFVERRLSLLNEFELMIGQVHAKRRARIVELIVKVLGAVFVTYVGNDVIGNKLADPLTSLGVPQFICRVERARLFLAAI